LSVGMRICPTPRFLKHLVRRSFTKSRCKMFLEDFPWLVNVSLFKPRLIYDGFDLEILLKLLGLLKHPKL
ncbi:MAG: hypothetical protein ACUVQY_07740, partial [Thermoproteota archaeon]